MKTQFTILFLCLFSFGWSQIPSYVDTWNHIEPDTVVHISGQDTSYTITEWWLKKGTEVTQSTQKNSVQKRYYYVNSNLSHLQLSVTEYQDGNRLSKTTIKKSGAKRETYDQNGNLLTVSHSKDNGQTFYVTLENTYESKNKKTTIFYYSNGNLHSLGKQRKAKIITGCDAGMSVFVKYGTWDYYNEDGSHQETRKEEIKKSVYKIEK